MQVYRAIAAVLLMSATAACSGTGIAAGPDPGVGGPTPDWDNLLVNQVEVASLAAAGASLPFVPAAPATLGIPSKVVMTLPEAVPPRDRVLGLVYDHATFGRFWILEKTSETNQEELEALAGCNAQEGCEGSWSLATLKDGTTALLIEGPVATSIVWLRGDQRFDVLGPSATFSGPHAQEVANAVTLSDVPA